MKKILDKYWLFLLSFLFLASFYFYYQTLFSENHNATIQIFQEKFSKKEKELDQFLNSKKLDLIDKGTEYICELNSQNDFYFHVYRNDSLLFWNSNQLPILRFAEIHFPSSGVLKLQNAWYYSKNITHGNLTIVASFLIKKEYSFENEYLINDFATNFELPFKASLALDKENSFQIFNNANEFLFSISPIPQERVSDLQSNVLVFLFILGLSILLFAIYRKLKFVSKKVQFLVSFLLVLTHYFFIRFHIYDFLDETTFFDHALYASSNWFPNLFILILNCIYIFFFTSILCRILKKLSLTKTNQFVTFLAYLFTLVFALFIAYLYQSLVKDSSIPLEIEKLFKLNFYSFWATLSMGILFYAYFIFVRSTCIALKLSLWRITSISMIWFLGGILYFLYEIFYGSEILFTACWPLIINGLILFKVIRSKARFSFNYGVILLFLFAAYISVNINEFVEIKEKQERELFAQQLASDQDVSTELEYQKLYSNLEKEKIFQKINEDSSKVSSSEFRDLIERKYLNEFWDKYEFDFFLFDDQLKAILNQENVNSFSLAYFFNLLERHSEVSEIDSNIYYIKDYTSQISYICKQRFYNSDSSKSILLFTTLKSKRIPEKIGFPRLLISDKANVFKAVENYSIAKYYHGRLVSQSGKFSYPIEDYALTNNIKHSSGYFNSEEYNHYLFRKNSRDLIVLSKKTASNFQLFTSFSYLFCFFGLFLLLPVVIANFNSLDLSKTSLALKIQMVLVSIVVVSLLFFGLASGKFISKQYTEYSTDLIREKVKSVDLELKQKLESREQLSIEKDGEYIDFLLEKFATVFVTDINMYDEKGYLLGSSRPKIFNAGLLSEQINRIALDNLKFHKKSEFFQQENIGNLNFLSAYIPLYNTDGDFLAYINLQHFGQQQGFENQIESFLVAIINTFILLLAFSIILSIIVSNWVTSPLKIIQQSFAKIQIGKYNEAILYESNDEIGSLVKNYNKKLEELAFTTQQLAQSERESAWREMAKQVAHEIKNPLTPMKLSLQHLQRVYDPNEAKSVEMLNRVIVSVIEQIDALTKIANEFSNFAKMPKENKEKIDILPLIENTLMVFKQENDTQINLLKQVDRIEVLADKDLILRVLNNLIKNAIQAIPNERQGLINFQISEIETHFQFSIQDNGKGISEELSNKIFMPNFTTKSTGTGLGLAMVKQIIELHEGEIWFESKEQNGTTFFFTLPKLD